MTRIWIWGLLAVLIWCVASYDPSRPAALGADAAPSHFSAARAEAALAGLLGPEKPHPAGSAQNAALRARLQAQLAQMGVVGHSLTAMSCFGELRWAAVDCGTVNDIVADVTPGQGKAILLMAHLDSVPAGPGAGDDGSGVAILLETIRALRTEKAPGHPVLALFSDGEEFGMLGAAAFLRDPRWRGRVGMVINAEARGNQGPSYLFQTSPGDAALVDLYARSVRRPATSSLYAEIYKFLPNDTDLTPFLQAGFAGYNFAFVGNVADYHTPLDRRAALDPRSLQAQGDNVLGLTRGLRGADFASLKGGDAIYFDIFGLWLPRLPQTWALPLALLSFALIALAGWRRREAMTLRRAVLAGLTPPALLAGALATGFLLHGIAALISGHSDPSFAHPLFLRIALAFGVWSMALLTMRGGSATASWLWLAGLGVAAAVFAPGLSPYFLFPSLIAAVLFTISGRGAALFLAALAGLIVWIGLAAQGEAIMGLAAHPLFTVPVALGLIALLPVLAAQPVKAAAWRMSLAVSVVVAIGLAVAAGFAPAYSARQPQRLNLHYVEADGRAWWRVDPVDKLPPSLRAVAAFSASPQMLAARRGYIAPRGGAQFAPPAAAVTRQGDTVELALNGSTDADGLQLMVPAAAHLRSATLNGIALTVRDGGVLVSCQTRDCAQAHVTLRFAGPGPVSLLLVEQRYGLQGNAAALAAARPARAVPSQIGDTTELVRRISVP